MSKARVNKVKNITSLILFVVGVAFCFLSLGAMFIGLDITPGFGMVQMFQMLIGLTCLTLSAFIYIHNSRRPLSSRSLQADIGVRLAATGLVFAYAAGLSDLIGIGTHVAANDFDRPFVGPLQLGGLALGILSILVGVYLYHTSRGSRESSSMEFLLNGGDNREE